MWLRFGLGTDGEHAVFTAGPGAQAYNFTNPCPPTCPPGEGAALLGPSASALAPGSVERVGGRISTDRARALTSAYLRVSAERVVGVRVERAALTRLLGDPAVHGVWFASGRTSAGDRSVVLLPAGQRGELVPAAGSDEASAASLAGELGGTPCTAADCPSW